MKNKKSIFCVLMALVFGILTSGCLSNDNGDEDATRISFAALVNDYNVEMHNETKEITQHFQSFDPGDILIIQDSIENISYIDSLDYTWIEFTSYPGEGLSIEGNIAGDYDPGDNVEIKLHLISVVFAEENPDTGDMWTFDMEVMEEGWDAEHTEYKSIPQKCIHHANPASKEVTMTFNKFINDIKEDLNNETLKITYWFQSLNKDDTVIIHDTIHGVSLAESGEFSNIEFSSFLGYNFSIAGDITSEFGPGDTIEIKMHIISVTFTYHNVYTDEEWTIKMETIKEGWDNKNHEYIPVPQEYVTLVPGDGSEAVVMTFNEFINDYRQNIDNESRIITYWFMSLNEGDTLIIRDTIAKITYNATRDYTSLEFTSFTGDDFPITGDITDVFATGDTIEIEVHIIVVSFTDLHPYTGEVWTIQMETMQEGWDNENKIPTLLPSEYIRHA